MSDLVDYHDRLKRLASDESAMGHGFGQPMTIIRQSDLLGAVAEHEDLALAVLEAQKVTEVALAEAKRLGDEVQELRVRLKLEQGDMITLDLRGSAQLSDHDVDKLTRLLSGRLFNQTAANPDRIQVQDRGFVNDEDEDDAD